MKKTKAIEGRNCPKCGSADNQKNKGFNESGTQRCVCKNCGTWYTLDSKKREYSEEIRQLAIKEYYGGASGRMVGKIHGMSKANVYNWIKKTEAVWISATTEFSDFELDEIYWFINKKPRTETRENTYIMTMISRRPRQIIGFAVDNNKSPETIQRIVDSAPPAKAYHTDGYSGYAEIDFRGYHDQNVYDKSDTHNVESINADLRHYIPGLRRRSRIFYRTLETFRAVLSVFIDAYNKFGEAKLKYNSRKSSLNILDFL